jgi:hypothetical protein
MFDSQNEKDHPIQIGSLENWLELILRAGAEQMTVRSLTGLHQRVGYRSAIVYATLQLQNYSLKTLKNTKLVRYH